MPTIRVVTLVFCFSLLFATTSCGRPAPAIPLHVTLTPTIHLDLITPTIPPPDQTASTTVVPTSTPTPTPSYSPTPSLTPTLSVLNAENSIHIRLLRLNPIFVKGLASSAAWSADGKMILVETNNGVDVLRIRDLALQYRIEDIVLLKPLADGNYLVKRQDTLMKFTPAIGELVELDIDIKTGQEGGAMLDISPDEKTFLTNIDAHTLRLENLETGEMMDVPVKSASGNEEVAGAVFSADGNEIIVTATNSRMRTTYLIFFDRNGRKIGEVAGGKKARFSPDGASVVVEKSSGRFLSIYDAKTMAPIVDVPEDIVYRGANRTYTYFNSVGYAFLDGHSKIAVLYRGSEYLLLIYDAMNGKILKAVYQLLPQLMYILFSPDEKNFLTFSADGQLMLWDTELVSPLPVSYQYDRFDNYPDIDFVMRQDGQQIAIPLYDSVRVLDVASGDTVGLFGNLFVTSTTFVGTDRISVSMRGEHYSQSDVFDIQTSEMVQRNPELVDCSYSPSGKIMICSKSSIWIYEADTGKALHNAVADYVAVSDDGHYVSQCNRHSQTIFLYAPYDHKLDRNLQADNQKICGEMAISADGLLLVSSAGYVWKLPEGTLFASFPICKAKRDGCNKRVFAGPGNLLLAVPDISEYYRSLSIPGDDFDLTTDLFDFTTGKHLTRLADQTFYYDVSFQSDGKSLLLLTNEGIEIWGVQ